MSDAIKGERSFGGRFTIDLSADPDLKVNEVYWFEQKEPSLMRPMARLRMLVVSKETDFAAGSVTYELRQISKRSEREPVGSIVV